MAAATSTWSVLYKDGTSLSQTDKIEGHAEIPFKAINWSKVEKIRFESQWAKTTITLPELDPSLQWSLRSRSVLAANVNKKGCSKVYIMMLVCHQANTEADKNSTVSVFYWFPNGVYHSCDFFECGEVLEYAKTFFKEDWQGIMPSHHGLQIDTTVHAVKE